jgi:hypothetical protein
VAPASDARARLAQPSMGGEEATSWASRVLTTSSFPKSARAKKPRRAARQERHCRNRRVQPISGVYDRYDRAVGERSCAGLPV